MPRIYSNKGNVVLSASGVLRESSAITRLCVVFNGLCRLSTGISLNDYLHVGSKLQQDISNVLLRWRLYEFVFCADITKMYRQIKISKRSQISKNTVEPFRPTVEVRVEYRHVRPLVRSVSHPPRSPPARSERSQLSAYHEDHPHRNVRRRCPIRNRHSGTSTYNANQIDKLLGGRSQSPEVDVE